MSYVADTLSNLIHQTAFFNLTWGNYLMIVVACVFLYLAIAKGFEPLLLVPIAFGMLLVNIYPDIMANPEDMSNGDEYSVEFTTFDVFGNEVRIYDERLCEAMKELTERRRNILLMSYFLEMTDAEIAEVMEMERFSVCRNRLHTLKLIRDMYEEG